MTALIREPAVSNLFYPGDPEELRYMVNYYIEKAPLYNLKPEAIVSPHAGYVYSGEVAGVSYKQLMNLDLDKHYDILLVGPSHYVPFNGISFGYYDYWETPLGEVKVNKKRIEELIKENQDIPFTLNTLPHSKEHSLEVQVPFLQAILKDFSIIPLVYGQTDFRYVEKIMDSFKNEETDLIVISTDLSHYYPYEVARQIDHYCNLAVERLDLSLLEKCEACGKIGLAAVIDLAKKRGWKGKVLDYKTSGDTAGGKDNVVGYGSYIFYR